MRIGRLSTHRRGQVLAGGATVVVVLGLAIVTADDGGRERVVATDDQTSSSSPSDTTRRATSSAEAAGPATNTTSADQSETNGDGTRGDRSKKDGDKEARTEEGRRRGRSGRAEGDGAGGGTTGTDGDPAPVAPPTTSGPPPAPPPPPDDGRLDRMAVLAWAKANRPDAAAPAMDPSSSCGVSVGNDVDGDDADGDLDQVTLARDCQGTFRASGFDGAGEARWIEIDSVPGGCEDVDVMALVWPAGSASAGAVVAMPTCDPSTWSSPGTAADPDGGLVDVAGSTFGDPTSFGWRAGMLGSPGDTQIDLLPDSGFVTFQR